MAELEMTPNNTLAEKSNSGLIPQFIDFPPVGENDQWEYKSMLQKYFLSSKKTKHSSQIQFKPLSLLSFPGMVKEQLRYPLVLDHITGEILSFDNYFDELCKEYLDDKDLNIIQALIPTTSDSVQIISVKKPNLSDRFALIKEIIESLFIHREKLIEPEKWINLCKELEKQLVTDKISIIGFSVYTPFLLLKSQLQNCNNHQDDFLEQINRRIAGLNDLLVLHGGTDRGSDDQFDFASNLLSFSKVEELAPLKASSKLPENRLRRIQKCYKILVDAQKSYRDYSTIVYGNKTLIEVCQVQEIFGCGSFHLSERNVCRYAKEYYQEEIQKFSLVIAAMKIADLELSQQYVEDLHDAYFENYDFNYLGDEDLKYMRLVLVVDYGHQLMKDASDFLDLVSGGAVVNV